jgi:hypothetical protein
MMTTNRHPARRRRGTVLLLAVGLITIVAILGSTFLVTSLLDARQSEAMAVKFQAEPLARGMVERVRALLARDLYANEFGPYGDASMNQPQNWRKYTDYPSEDDPGTSGAGENEEVDPYLSSPWTPGIQSGASWPHLTRLPNTSKPNGSAVTRGDVTKVDPNAPSDAPYVDTDGDGRKDALLLSTDVRDIDGNEYLVAVRITDLSGLFGIRDAEIDPSPPPPFPVDQITKSYAPGEEMFLRYEGVATNVGRLPQAMRPGWQRDDIRLLTTYSVSRPVMRIPGFGYIGGRRAFQRLVLSNDRNSYVELHKPDNRNWLFQQMKAAIGENPGMPPDQSDAIVKTAAHFVANLWAYTSPEPADDENAFAFRYQATPAKYAYGLTEQLVISDAYAYFWLAKDAAGVTVGQGEAYALELLNPTPEPVDASNYHFGAPGNVGGMFDPGQPVEQGERIVLYALSNPCQIPDGAGGAQDADIGTFGFQPDGWDGAGTYWKAVDFVDLRYLVNNPVHVWRNVETHRIPIDRIDADSELDFNPDVTPPQPGSTALICIGRRDDHPNRMRVTVGNNMAVVRYEDEADVTEANLQNHSLGQDNHSHPDFSVSDPPAEPWDAVYEGFYIDRRNYASYVDDDDMALDTTAEIARVYLRGPDVTIDGSDHYYRSFPYAMRSYRDDPNRGRPNYLENVLVTTRQYPDIPWVCLLHEFMGIPELSRPSPQDDDNEMHDNPDHWQAGGKVNVNTAPKEVLEKLFPAPGTPEAQAPVPGWNFRQQWREELADEIVIYRENGDNRHEHTWGDVDDLREQPWSQVPGYLSPGEVAIPVMRYANGQLADAGIDADDPRHQEIRNWFWSLICDRVTVKSDTFAVYVVVQIQPRTLEGQDPDYENPLDRWTYLALIDRSVCVGMADNGQAPRPAVRLFSEVR